MAKRLTAKAAKNIRKVRKEGPKQTRNRRTSSPSFTPDGTWSKS
jgi:hypothetical protein